MELSMHSLWDCCASERISYHADAESARAIVAEVTASGGEAIAVQADMAQPDDIERLFTTVDKELGTLSGLVNNVGVLETQCRVDEMDAERLQRIMATNVIGYFLCAAHAVRRMSTTHGGVGGAIVNVSSAASRLGSPGSTWTTRHPKEFMPAAAIPAESRALPRVSR
jgi:NAD(P)-dependent dehydrogenase (short-subunit alcohol dehydrogenase family)